MQCPRRDKRTADPVELKLQVVVGHSIQVLGTELGFPHPCLFVCFFSCVHPHWMLIVYSHRCAASKFKRISQAFKCVATKINRRKPSPNPQHWSGPCKPEAESGCGGARDDVTRAPAAGGGGEGGASRAAGRPRSVRDPGLAGVVRAAGRLCPHPCWLPSGASLGPLHVTVPRGA